MNSIFSRRVCRRLIFASHQTAREPNSSFSPGSSLLLHFSPSTEPDPPFPDSISSFYPVSSSSRESL
uniref:Uncharacterized protein n=1 Tax=Brassica oleracea var. oleracea TaxID=109376 RepID=A0A0D3DM84_BRAOL